MDAELESARPPQDVEATTPIGRATKDTRKVVAASTIGTAIEYYDYFIFGTAAATVFPALFFPDFSPAAGTLASFAAFGAGFLARPLGAAVAGHYGDRIGRKSMLVATLLVMGIATFLIGLLPPYSVIGIWAPILLVLLRLAQGFGVGGELPGAQLMCVEHAPRGRRGFFGSWPQAASPIGLAMSTGAFVIMSAVVSNQQFTHWGWRIPFLLTGVLVGVGIFVRLKTHESPEFERVRQQSTQEKMPIRVFIRDARFQAARGIGMYLGVTVVYYVLTTFLIAYAIGTLEMPRTTVLFVVLATQPIFFAICLAGGALSDRFGRRSIYVVGTLGAGVAAFPAFALIDQASSVSLFLGMLLLGGFLFLYVGVQGAFFAELFDVRIRYTGTSLSIGIATLVGGAFTPAVGTLLANRFGSSGVAFLVLGVSLIAATAAWVGGGGRAVDRPERQTV
ncbi:MFS transporter [Amycolatopsis palatopharyngis]|uniref:MFS transporter n=1 Tax=Amycolatopsis palatopharyngis TaxID=187982 RepID=UPI0013BE9B01|nr:MFS transporter [Amycolatopsis palatopharyngis]